MRAIIGIQFRLLKLVFVLCVLLSCSNVGDGRRRDHKFFYPGQSGRLYQYLSIMWSLQFQKVHITQGDCEGKAVIISWLTPDELGPDKVEYGTSHKEYEFSAKGLVSNYAFHTYKSGYNHHCLA